MYFSISHCTCGKVYGFYLYIGKIFYEDEALCVEINPRFCRSVVKHALISKGGNLFPFFRIYVA